MRKCRYCGRRHEPIPHKETVILGYYKNTPIIKAVPEEGTGFLTFYCQYCKREHLHGRGDGHRVAHCTWESNSPFRETGYFLNRVMVLGQPIEEPSSHD